MKNSTKLIAASTLTLALFLGAVSGASAYKGDPETQGPNYTPERHEAMTQAFDNNDFNAWSALMATNENKGRVVDMINEGNFQTFADAHKLALSGDTDGAKAKRAELGLGMKDGSGNGQGMKSGQGRGQGLRNGSGRSMNQ